MFGLSHDIIDTILYQLLRCRNVWLADCALTDGDTFIMSTPEHNFLNDPNEPIPWMQQLLDSPFILLVLGVMIPMIVYNLWGVIEILLLPVTQ